MTKKILAATVVAQLAMLYALFFTYGTGGLVTLIAILGGSVLLSLGIVIMVITKPSMRDNLRHKFYAAVGPFHLAWLLTCFALTTAPNPWYAYILHGLNIAIFGYCYVRNHMRLISAARKA